MSEKKVKTKKVVKRRLKIKGVLFLACFFISIFLVYKVLSSLKISSITVDGNDILKDTEIIKQSGLNEINKIFGFSSKKTCKSILENKLVKSCEIKRTFSRKVKIIVEENKPLFYYTTENSIVLSSGERIEVQNSGGIPTLINMVPKEILDDFISGLSEIDSDIIRSISEIKYSPSASKEGIYIDEELFMFMMNDGNTVYINNRRMSNMNYYDEIYASIGDKKGTYYFDCDYNNIVFKEYGSTDTIEPGE